MLHPAGQWNLLVQMIHWRGDTATGGPTALDTLETGQVAAARLPIDGRAASPSITTSDAQRRIAAVISDAGHQVMHEYLLADPASSTSSNSPCGRRCRRRCDWPAVADAQVLDAMAAPLCDAYLGSCR